MTKERLEFRVNEEIADIIGEVAKAEGKSVSNVIRVLIKEGMATLFTPPAERLDEINEDIQRVKENLRSLEEQKNRIQRETIEESKKINWD